MFLLLSLFPRKMLPNLVLLTLAKQSINTNYGKMLSKQQANSITTNINTGEMGLKEASVRN